MSTKEEQIKSQLRQEVIEDKLMDMLGSAARVALVLEKLQYIPQWKDYDSAKLTQIDIKKNVFNARIIINEDPEFKERPYRFCELGDYYRGTEKISGFEHEDMRLASWFCEKWHLELNFDVINKLLDEVADNNTFNPIRDFMNNLEYNGKSDLALAIKLLNLEPNLVTIKGKQVDLNEEFIMKWMIAAVNRVMVPGSQCDSALVAVGQKGGEKKSSLPGYFGYSDVRGREWFGSPHLDLKYGYKDAQSEVNENWINLIDEFDYITTDRDAYSRLKTFIITRVHHYIPKYGRRAKKVPCGCVFFCTSNKPQFLAEKGGERRWWPILFKKSGRIDTEGFLKVRDNLWAEAVVRYKANEMCYFDEVDQLVVDKAIQSYFIEDAKVENVIAACKQSISSWTLEQVRDNFENNENGIKMVTIRLALDDTTKAKVTKSLGGILYDIGWDRKRDKSGNDYLWYPTESFVERYGLLNTTKEEPTNEANSNVFNFLSKQTYDTSTAPQFTRGILE